MDSADWRKITWVAHQWPQKEALSRTEYEILYGGARWGGKTDAGMARLLYDVGNPLLRALVVRKNSEDLKDWIDRAKIMYQWTWAVFSWQPAEIRFPSGAVIRTGHLKDDNAYTKYQGHEYQRQLIEELTQISNEENYLKLISSCRSTVPWLPAQIFATTNPWGIGHSRVKKRFIDVELPWQTYYDPISWRSRVFIPAKVEDNPTLMQNDPQYVKFLESLPSDLRKAWRDWSRDVFETKGSLYANYIKEAREQNRICAWIYEPTLPIYWFWDIWIDDETVGIIAQFYGKEIRIVDCLYGNEYGLDHWINVIREKWYIDGTHFFPHDIQVREQTYKAQTRKSYLEKNGIKAEVTPNILKEDWINMVRAIFNKLWFDKTKADKLIEALNIYRRKRDDKNLVYWDVIHDRSSNFADALRYLAVCYEKIIKPKPIETQFTQQRYIINNRTGKVKYL